MEHPAFCQQCGAGLAPAARFCPRCGVAVQAGVEDAPSSPRTELERGLAALREGDLDHALPLLAVAAETDDGFAVLAYGTALLRRRRYQEALAPLERAAALMPERGEALAYLGMARLHTLDPAGARAALERAAAIAPDSFAVRLKHAEFLYRLGYYREALAEAQRTLGLSAPDAESLAFAERLADLARQKAPQAYTRPIGRLPRLPGLRLFRRERSAARRPTGMPQPSSR